MTNEEIVNHQTGEGPLLDALKEFKTYRSGPQNKGNLNTCHNYVTQLLKRIPTEPQDPTKETKDFFTTYDELSVIEEYNAYNHVKPLSAMNIFNPNPDPTKEYDPIRTKRWTTQDLGCGRRLKGKRDVCKINLKANDDAPTTKGQNELVMNDWTSDLPDDELSITSGDSSPTKSIPTDGLSEADKVQKTSLVRTAGTLTTYTSFSKAALTALGVAGNIVGTSKALLPAVQGLIWIDNR